MPRTLLSSLLVLAAGVTALAAATHGFRAFTTETARRIEVREHPRPLPDARLETADGRIARLEEWRGRWLLVDFIYTRCTTYCSVQGAEFTRLQDRLARPITEGKVALLSVSFDPTHDGPAELAAYQQHAGARATGWIAARPVSERDLAALMQTFGVTAVPDGQGGFVHNAAIAVVDPRGRLVAILDWDDPATAAEYVTARLGRWGG